MKYPVAEAIIEAVRRAVIVRYHYSNGRCCSATHAIAKMFGERRETFAIVEGQVTTDNGQHTHWWGEWEGFRIDVTADQFNKLCEGEPFPEVLIEEKKLRREYREEKRYTYRDSGMMAYGDIVYDVEQFVGRARVYLAEPPRGKGKRTVVSKTTV